MNRLGLIFFILGHGAQAWAAPCCGGTSNVPALISGDHQAQISATLSHADVVADASVQGKTKYRSEDDETAFGFKLDAATLLTDSLQAGITLPLIQKQRSRGPFEASSGGLGDITLNLGYEVLPEWEYSEIKPRGWLFLSAIIPTGRSLYDSTEAYRIDSRGRGFYSLALGGLFTKSWGNWDVSFLAEGHRAFSKTITNSTGTLILNPGWGASGSLGGGWSPGGGSLRVGLSVNPSVEAPVETQGLVSGRGEATALWALATQVSYLAADDLSLSLTFSDQTLIPGSSNVALNRSVALLIQKRWDR